MTQQVHCPCGAALDNAQSACPVCGQGVVSLEPLRFGSAAEPTKQLNDVFGYRAVLVEQSAPPRAARQPRDVHDDVYSVLDPPEVIPVEDDYAKVKELLRKARWDVQRTEWPLETHWPQCLLFPFRAWPVAFGLAFGYSLLIPIAIAIFLQPQASGPADNPMAGVCILLSIALVCCTCDFFHRAFRSAVRGEAGIPPWPISDFKVIGQGVLRCIGSFLAGPGALAGVAAWFWLSAGELTAVDRLIISELLLVASCWWFFAFLSVVKTGAMRDAAPLSVIAAIRQLGPPAISVVLFAAGFVFWLLPWFFGSLTHLHRSGFEGWFSLLLCLSNGFFWFTFLLRCNGLCASRSTAGVPSTAPQRAPITQ